VKHWWWWLRVYRERRGRFLIKKCRLVTQEDGTLLIHGLRGEGVALWVQNCEFDTRLSPYDDAFFRGDWDIDRLLESESPVKILLTPKDPELIEREVDGLL